MATIFYLASDIEDSQHKIRISALHDHLHSKSLTEIPIDDFENLYEQISTTETRNLGQIVEEWTDGSDNECAAFREQNVRSIGVGDIVRIDDDYYIKRPAGWDEVEVVD